MRHAQFLTAAAGVLGLIALAGAQQDQKQPPTKPGETYRPPATDTYQPKRDARPVDLWASEKLIDAKVRGTNDDKLGEIKDLVLARERGRITFALVEHGGVAKIGEKVTAVPYAAFTWDDQKKDFTLPVNEERFNAAPTMEKGEWKTLSDPNRIEPIHSYFNVPREKPSEIDEARDRPANPPRLAPGEFPVLRVTEIKGKELMSNDGREIGKIDDLVIDAASGRVAFVVVTFGGVMGIGSDKIPMPWASFDVNKEGHLYAINVDKEQLTNAPRLTGRDWPELREVGYGARVYKHYGRSASWLEVPVGSKERTSAMAEYDRLCAKGTSRTVTGTVTAVEECSPMDGVPKIVVVSVDNGPGEPTRLQLAPRVYLDQQGYVVKTGDKIAVKGRDCEIDGKRAVIVTEVTPAKGKAVVLRQSDGTCAWQWK